jgi:hypothetical protein
MLDWSSRDQEYISVSTLAVSPPYSVSVAPLNQYSQSDWTSALGQLFTPSPDRMVARAAVSVTNSVVSEAHILSPRDKKLLQGVLELSYPHQSLSFLWCGTFYLGLAKPTRGCQIPSGGFCTSLLGSWFS